MFRKELLTTLLVSLLSASQAFCDCISSEEVELIKQLKVDFLSGDYDDFFEASDPSGALPNNVTHDAKVQLIQYIGVPTSCADMARKEYSNNFMTLLTAFAGEDDNLVFVFFSLLKVKREFEIIGMKLSTDYSEIYRYVR